MKTCGRCQEAKSPEDFCRDSTRVDGRHPYCKSCTAAASREWYRQNKAAHLARARAWKRRNRDRQRAKGAAWAKANPEKRRAILRKSSQRRYYADVERSRATGRAQVKRFAKQNPTAYRAIRRRAGAKQKAKRRGAIGVDTVDYEQIKTRDRMVCHLCRKKVSPKDLEFDHVVPLVAGGPHVASNIAVSHRRCNRSKAGKVLTLF